MKSIYKVKLFYNSLSRTSRDVLGLIRNTGIIPEIIDLKLPSITSPSSSSSLSSLSIENKEEINNFISHLKLSFNYSSLNKEELNFKNNVLNNKQEEIINDILLDSSRLQLPIVDIETINQVKICRPAQSVLDILPLPQLKHYVLENGNIIKSDGTLITKERINDSFNYKRIIVEQIDSIRIVSINRPECRNAVDETTAIELLDAFEKINNDDTVKVSILTGTNGTFCAGYDLKSLSNNPLIHDSTQSSRTNTLKTISSYDFSRSGYMGPSRLHMKKPVIAAIEGYAVAGGLELSLWCDIRIVSKSTIFGVHCRRWGVPLIDGGTIRLPRLIGQSRAMDMILSGRDVDANEALSFGLANYIVEKGCSLQKSIDYAFQLSKFPSECMSKDREMIYKQWDLNYEDALREEGKSDEFTNKIMKLATEGATRFAKGKGRGGDKNNI